MKRLLILIALIILTSGCNKQQTETNITTIIENNSNNIVAINYPNTIHKKLNKELKQYVDNIYNEFKINYTNNKNKPELNIDYTYKEIDSYINISITSIITFNNYNTNRIKTFVYDKNENKLLSLEDILNKDSYTYIIDYIKNDFSSRTVNCLSDNTISNLNLFTFNYNNLTIYFNTSKDKCDITQISIPLNKLSHTLVFNKSRLVFNEDINYTSTKETIDINKPAIALTFDDGPSRYTNEILDILNENNANATFFVLGNKVQIYETTLKKMIKLNNEIGNHSYNHKLLSRLDEEELKNQISKTQNIIKETLGYTPTIFRPTYGSINKKVRNNTDLKIILWTVDTMDWKLKNSKKIADRLLKKVKDGDIILMHDTYQRTLETIKIIVPELKKKGFQLVTVSTLEEIKKIKDSI